MVRVATNESSSGVGYGIEILFRKLALPPCILGDCRVGQPHGVAQDMVFDLQKILDFEGDTGPYCQYTHARACAILRKAKLQKIALKSTIDTASLSEDVEHTLITALSQFPERVQTALNQYRPHIIAQYLLSLSRIFNEFYHKCPCLQEENEKIRNARLVLIDCSRQVLHNGLRLLSITPLEEM